MKNCKYSFTTLFFYTLFQNNLKIIKFHVADSREMDRNKLSYDSCNKIACVPQHGSSYLLSHCTHIVNFNITNAWQLRNHNL